MSDLLTAATTADVVAHALERYDERDHAIAVLEDDIRVRRRMVEQDLRSLLRPHTQATLGSPR